jgi:hypothetical protein
MTQRVSPRFLGGLEPDGEADQQLTLSHGNETADTAEPMHDGVIGDRCIQAPKQTVERVRVRVNSQGSAYVEGLQDGRVYDAHVKPKWPGTVWLEGTGLSHSCFLFDGMYELVDLADPAPS